ncbi:MAG: AIR synthase-related protein, partial [Pirellulales bacterium]
LAVAWQTPFISGKDSLNNEFSYFNAAGEKQTIAIPPTLLISAMGQVDDVTRCVTMDLKAAGNALYLVGATKDELGGSHFALINGLAGGSVPRVQAATARATFTAMHQAIHAKLCVACHDLSEGGLAVAAAEMAFAGGLGAALDLDAAPCDDPSLATHVRLFSESNSRFLCEVPAESAADFEAVFEDVVPFARIGEVNDTDALIITMNRQVLLQESIADLKETWQTPLRW